MTDKKLSAMPYWEVEFWPDKVVRAQAHDEHEYPELLQLHIILGKLRAAHE